MKLIDRLKNGQLDRLLNSRLAKQYKLADQFQLMKQGDVVRRLGLAKPLMAPAGWAKARLSALVSPAYYTAAFSIWYRGPAGIRPGRGT